MGAIFIVETVRMEQRLLYLPCFKMVDETVAVAWNGPAKRAPYFILTFEAHSKTGKRYPGYLAAWRFKHNYLTEKACRAAIKHWLSMELVRD